MKKLMFAVLAVVGFIGFTACEKEKIVAESDLPQAAKTYIESHFSGAEVIQVVKDINGLKKSYDVYLNNGVELEFNKSGEPTSIKSNRQQALPDSVIPAKILMYIQANFASEYIISWELDDRFQEVELNNGMELKFSKAGDFIRID